MCEQLKKCTKCGEEKFLSEFYELKNGKYGVYSICRICLNSYKKAYNKANPDKIKAYRKAYNKANSDKIKADQKAYNKANSDKFKAYHKAYKQSNSDKFKAYKKAYDKAYKQTNSDQINALNSKRRALKLNQTHPDCDNIQVKRFYRVCSFLSKYTGTKYHVDHILPISKGGPHHHDNLQIITQTLNNQKKDNTNFEHPDLKHWTELPIELLNWVKINNLKSFSKVVKDYGIDNFKNKLLKIQNIQHKLNSL